MGKLISPFPSHEEQSLLILNQLVFNSLLKFKQQTTQIGNAATDQSLFFPLTLESMVQLNNSSHMTFMKMLSDSLSQKDTLMLILARATGNLECSNSTLVIYMKY